jgi:hypothetical protein
MRKPERTTVIAFAIGAAASLIGAKFAKSKAARRLAVRGVAGGIRLKDDALRKAGEIREEAQDVYEEARRKTGCCEEPRGADAAL